MYVCVCVCVCVCVYTGEYEELDSNEGLIVPDAGC